jgi:VanZ family protein
MLALIRSRRVWLGLFVIWVGALWWLSSGRQEFPVGQDIVGIDKVYHFGYFGLGGLFLSAFLYRWKGGKITHWSRFLAAAVAGVFLIGAMDEFHQSFVPGRSGNDPYDLTADALGALCGHLGFRLLRRWLPRAGERES